jgi:cob(I)alamin adenosyltransferase
MAFRIYTKTGDEGMTGLIGGGRVLKSDHRIEAYGTIDELNSFLGLCRDLLKDGQEKQLLGEIQDRLFVIGSEMAKDPARETKMKIPALKEEDVTALEKGIDRMDGALPEMKNFILPGGHPTVSHIHIARCVCRRAERNCVGLNQISPLDPMIIRFLNRLSDYLFTLARFEGKQLGVEEIPWRPAT